VPERQPHSWRRIAPHWGDSQGVRLCSPDVIRLAGPLALVVAALLVGCDSGEPERWMMPPPVIMQDPRLDFTRFVAPENRSPDVRVVYATTRAPASPGTSEHYLRRGGDVALLGLANVQLGEPGWTWEELVESDRSSTAETLRPARVTSVDEFGAMGTAADDALIAAIDRQLEGSRTGAVVIYVPGYRVDFNRVMVLMGSWAHYLGGSSPVVAFSWPTGTHFWNYLFDCPRARRYIPEIERLVALIAERSKATRLNLIGFSCGSPLLAEALVHLRERHPEEDHAALQQRYRIGNALFVAADIDLQTFARAQVPALSDLAVRTQFYLSEDDFALKVSGFLTRTSRLGRPRLEELSRDDLMTLASNERLAGIDVAGVYGAHELGGIRGHGYWIANARVSTDILLSMMYPFSPAQRALVHGPGPGLWAFPGDYPQRVGDAVFEWAPELHRELH